MSRPTLEDVAGALASSEPEQRRIAAASLPELDARDAVPMLLAALGDAEWRVRKEATRSAAAFADDPALVAGLLALLGSGDDVGLRNAAVEALAGCGSAAVRALEAGAPGLDADGRKLAIEALGRSGDPAATSPLARAVADADVNVRQAALEALARLGTAHPEAEAAAGPALLDALDDPEPFVRLTALEGLSALGTPIPFERLEPLLADPLLGASAVAAAAASGDPRAPRALAERLATARGTAASKTLAALGKLSEHHAADVARAVRASGEALGAWLLATARGALGGATLEAEGPLSEPFPAQRESALALSLAALAGCEGAASAALDLLAEPALATEAQQALVALGGRALPEVLARLASPGPPPAAGPDPAALLDVVAEIARAEGGLDEPLSTRARRAISTAARAGEPRSAIRALLALAEIGDARDLPLAAALLASENAPVARAAEATLETLAGRDPAAARRFADAAAGRGDALAAAVALGAIARAGARLEPEDEVSLARAAAAGAAPLRGAAVLALAAASGERAAPVLAFSLADESPEVRLAAARGLGVAAGARAGVALGAAPLSPEAALELATRSGDADLVAATVRALGELLETGRVDAAERAASPGLEAAVCAALSGPAASAPSGLALAAVEALGRAGRLDRAHVDALSGALLHPDPVVARASLLKLGSEGPRAVAPALGHPSAEVRLLAAELLASPTGRPEEDEAALRALAAQIEAEEDPEVLEIAHAAVRVLSFATRGVKAT